MIYLLLGVLTFLIVSLRLTFDNAKMNTSFAWLISIILSVSFLDNKQQLRDYSDGLS